MVLGRARVTKEKKEAILWKEHEDQDRWKRGESESWRISRGFYITRNTRAKEALPGLWLQEPIHLQTCKRHRWLNLEFECITAKWETSLKYFTTISPLQSTLSHQCHKLEQCPQRGSTPMRHVAAKLQAWPWTPSPHFPLSWLPSTGHCSKTMSSNVALAGRHGCGAGGTLAVTKDSRAPWGSAHLRASPAVQGTRFLYCLQRELLAKPFISGDGVQ